MIPYRRMQLLDLLLEERNDAVEGGQDEHYLAWLDCALRVVAAGKWDSDA